MKEWMKPELEQLEISETKQGATKGTQPDQIWMDDWGEWNVTFTPS